MILTIAEQANADSWLDIFARLVDSLPGLITAAVGAVVSIAIARRGAARHEETQHSIAEVRDSTVNDHARPLRYDVDDVLREVRAGQALTERIGAEVREDRASRRAADDTLARRLDLLSHRVETSIAKHHPEDAQ